MTGYHTVSIWGKTVFSDAYLILVSDGDNGINHASINPRLRINIPVWLRHTGRVDEVRDWLVQHIKEKSRPACSDLHECSSWKHKNPETGRWE